MTDSRTAPRSGSHAQRAYDALLNRLANGALAPGDWVDRRALADDLAVSLAPVNEAVVRLTNEGLLEPMARRGTRVAVMAPEQLREQLLVREALECQAARLYCGEPVAIHLDELQPLAEAVDRAELYSTELRQRDLELHRHLVQLAQCCLLEEHFERVMRLSLILAWDHFLPTVTPAERCSHAELIEQLAAGGPDAAETAMRRHIRWGKEPIYRYRRNDHSPDTVRECGQQDGRETR